MTEEITNINRYREIADTHPVASVREEAERLVNRATPGQKYAVHEAASILAYWRGVNNNPSEVYVPGLPEQQVQNVSGIRSIRLTQSTLADYLEKAFVAGQRAEFGRLTGKKSPFRREGLHSHAVDELIRLDESRTDEKLLQAIAAADADADARDEGDTRDENSLEDHNIQGLGAYRDVFDADGEQ
jgi:hypothetical protein